MTDRIRCCPYLSLVCKLLRIKPCFDKTSMRLGFVIAVFINLDWLIFSDNNQDLFTYEKHELNGKRSRVSLFVMCCFLWYSHIILIILCFVFFSPLFTYITSISLCHLIHLFSCSHISLIRQYPKHALKILNPQTLVLKSRLYLV